MEVTITRAGSLLWLELPEDRRQLLVALTDREFALTATAATLSFELGADGAARQALFRMGDTQVVLDRQASPGP
jgi:hypothetical protein